MNYVPSLTWSTVIFSSAYFALSDTKRLVVVAIRCRLFGLTHGGTWRTMHCRLCIKIYGTGKWVCECVVGLGFAAPPPPPPPTHYPFPYQFMQRRQCIVLQVPPWIWPMTSKIRQTDREKMWGIRATIGYMHGAHNIKELDGPLFTKFC
jgi:hypothetical protein